MGRQSRPLTGSVLPQGRPTGAAIRARDAGFDIIYCYAAHGLTLTAAFEISLACDIILAAPKAKFGLVETVVGLTPSMGGPQRLAERAGSGRARELVMTGDLYDAATLHSWGVVNAVHDDVDAAARAPGTYPLSAADPGANIARHAHSAARCC